MQNFKHNKNLGGTQGSKHSRPLFMGAITFMQATNKRDAFLIYIFLAHDLKTWNTRSLFSTKITRLFSKE
jgi:hypothetical protein